MHNTLGIIIGTRPELIKVAPLIQEFKKRGLNNYVIINSAQHSDLLDPYWKTFDIIPDIVLDSMVPGQNLSTLTSRLFVQIQEVIDKFPTHFGALLAQGDTTTVMVASLVSFYNKIPFIHLEAGLRSNDMVNPYPEELNRKITSIVSTLHLAPTKMAVDNLLAEKIPMDLIQNIGNTVVDALESVQSNIDIDTGFENVELGKINYADKNWVLITCHRRENHGTNLDSIIVAIQSLAKKYSHLEFIWLVHPNPNVKDKVLESELQSIINVHILPPVEYLDILKIMKRSCIALSDSGGVQEEAPSFNLPVLVLRETTERPEGVNSGVAILVGANVDLILEQFEKFTSRNLQNIENPYGDGKAAIRAVDAILNVLNLNIT